jgi:DNA-binding MarR family transcriptional regulator
MTSKDQLYTLLKEIFLIIDDGDRRFFDRYSLTVSRFYAIFHIGEEPGISSSHLSNRMLCDKSNITRIVKGLEADGHVMRKPHETDGRSRRLFLTRKGRGVLDEASVAHDAYNEARLDCISEIEQDNLLGGLTKLKQRLQEALYPSMENT